MWHAAPRRAVRRGAAHHNQLTATGGIDALPRTGHWNRLGRHFHFAEQLIMDWKVILIVIGFCVGGWWLGKLMTGSGRNMDDGGGG